MTFPPFTPPVKRGGIGEKIAAFIESLVKWLASTPLVSGGGMFAGLVSRLVRNNDERIASQLITFLLSQPPPYGTLLAGILSILANAPLPEQVNRYSDFIQALRNDPKKYVSLLRQAIAENPPTDTLAREIGRFVSGIVLVPLVKATEDPNADPEETYYTIEGYIVAAITSVYTLGIVAEILGVGQIQTVAMLAGKIIDGLGLQDISAQLFKQVTNAGFGEISRRFYNRRFRPANWTVSQLTQLYALRAVPASYVRDRLRNEGYREEDIDLVIKLSEREVTARDTLAGLELGVIGTDEAARKLHALGYGAEAVSYLLKLHTAKRERDDLQDIAQIAYTAFKKGIITEAQFRQMRAAARVPQARIDLEVKLAQLEGEVASKDLTIGNIKAAFQAGVIARQEAEYYLTQEGVEMQARQILIATWEEQMRPKSARLNASTITAAYKAGVISREETIQRLTAIGWTKQDADLILTTAERSAVPPRKSASPSVIVDAFRKGIISYNDALVKLTEAGYSEEDARLRLQSATIRPSTGVKQLSRGEIVNLHERGFITFDEAVSMLVNLGYDEDTAELVILASASTYKDGSLPNTGG